MKKIIILATLCAMASIAAAGPFYDGPQIGIDLSQLACAGVASDTNNRASIAEQQADIVQTTLTLSGSTRNQLKPTDGSAEGESLKLIDFDAGAVTVLGVIVDLTCVTGAGATNTYVMGLGTVAAADDATLTSTEVDLCPSTTINTTGGTVRTNAWNAILAAPATFDGTATAKALYLNMGIADAAMNASFTNTVSGTITLITTKATDNQ